MDHQQQHQRDAVDVVHLPAPTAWPLVLALGLTLAFLGLVTSMGISLLGLVLIVAGSVGWFREVLPHERHESVPVRAEEIELTTAYRSVARIKIDESHRARLPVRTPSVVAGIKGGAAGGIAMIAPALLYGIVVYHSIWYPVNLLGGAGVAEWANPTEYQLMHFRLGAVVTASIIHIVVSLLVGLLYGATLPMWPRHPILLGGIIAPLLWTGLLHGSLGLINPFLDQRIHWVPFVISQVAFGLVAGWVVARQTDIVTAQYLPFVARVGLETPGLMPEREASKGPEGESK
ncbi:MAG TPA: hypothetical protein VGM27_16855 [Acidobacteriaceae bacterium]|jgi:hypothetical protein